MLFVLRTKLRICANYQHHYGQILVLRNAKLQWIASCENLTFSSSFNQDIYQQRRKVSCEETTSKVFSVFAVGLLHGLFVSLCADNVLRCEFSTVSEVCLFVWKNAWFTEEIFNWLGGCVKHVKHGFEGSADRYCILSSHKAMTVTITVDTGTPPVYDGPPSSLFLKLCGDVESNPGPSTDELIEELGRTLGIRPDTVSTDMQSLRTTVTSVSIHISVLLTERLQKKEEDIEEMKSRTKGLNGRLKKIEEEVEQQQITNRQDNIVFFGVPEKEGRESSDDCASTMVTLLNQHDPLRRWKSDDMARVQRLGKKERETDREGSGSGRPRPVLQTHSSSDDRPTMSDGRQTQGRIDTTFQRHQHQWREVSGPVRGSECSGGRAKPDDTAMHTARSSGRRTQQHSQCKAQKSVRIHNWNVEGLFSN